MIRCVAGYFPTVESSFRVASPYPRMHTLAGIILTLSFAILVAASTGLVASLSDATDANWVIIAEYADTNNSRCGPNDPLLRLEGFRVNACLGMASCVTTAYLNNFLSDLLGAVKYTVSASGTLYERIYRNSNCSEQITSSAVSLGCSTSGEPVGTFLWQTLKLESIPKGSLVVYQYPSENCQGEPPIASIFPPNECQAWEEYSCNKQSFTVKKFNDPFCSTSFNTTHGQTGCKGKIERLCLL